MIYFLPNASRLGKATNGGIQGHKRNLKILSEVADLTESSLVSKEKSFFEKVRNVIFSPCPFIFSLKQVRKAKKEFLSLNAETVFLDTSLLGYLTKYFKNKNKKIIVFFHNVEQNYYKVFNRFFSMLAKREEKKSVKYADVIIVLNERDKEELIRLYGKQYESKIDILSASFEDSLTKADVEKQENRSKQRKIKGLFFGKNLPANFNGIKWFTEHVAEHINCDFYIVGSGFEDAKEILTKGNTEVIGEVENIGEYIVDSDFLALPIFDGSGMKIKTAEALMYGKTIFGTKESFEGYNLDYDKVGALCDSAEDFIAAINKYAGECPENVFNEYSRNIYLNNFSNESARKKMQEIIKRA